MRAKHLRFRGKVQTEDLTEPPTVAIEQRDHDTVMVRDRFSPAFQAVIDREAVRPNPCVEPFEFLQQDRVVRGFPDGPMDRLVAVIVGGLIIGLERRDHAMMGLLDPPQLRFRNARRGEFSRHRFQRPDDAESLNNFFGFRAPDLNAAVARWLDQTLGGEDADRLPDRAARAQESAAQIHLDKACPRRQLAADDEVAQHIRDRTARFGTAGSVRNHGRGARKNVGCISYEKFAANSRMVRYTDWALILNFRQLLCMQLPSINDEILSIQAGRPTSTWLLRSDLRGFSPLQRGSTSGGGEMGDDLVGDGSAAADARSRDRYGSRHRRGAARRDLRGLPRRRQPHHGGEGTLRNSGGEPIHAARGAPDSRP